MARKIILTCDKCSSDDEVDTYAVSVAGATPYEVDLCKRCAAPLKEFIELGQLSTATWGGALTSASREPELRTKVHTPEELDRLEEEYRARQKKKK